MQLIVITNPNTPYGEREQIKTPGVARTAIEGNLLVAYSGGGDKLAQFNCDDVRNYHLEEN